MRLYEITDELEIIKSHIWEYVENEETELQKQIKYTTNLLLDLLESLNMEKMSND